MIITIKGADFSSANIGTLSTYIISKSIGSGAAFDIPNFVDKNSSVNWVITLDEGYTFGAYSVTMGGEVITPTVVDNVMTISIAEVTGNVRIVVATVNENTGEEDEPETPSQPTGLGTLKEQMTFNNNDVDKYSSNTWKSDVNYFTYDKIPVEPNTQYRLKNARATYFLQNDGLTSIKAYNKERPNLNSVVTDWTFTTPADCYFMSSSFKYEDRQPDEVELEKVIISEGKMEEVLLNTLNVEFLENKGLGSTSYVIEDNDGYYVVKDIPIDDQHKYKLPYGRSTWFLDSNKNGKYRVNLRTETNDYSFQPQAGIAYVTSSILTTDVPMSDAKIYITPYNKQYIKVS